MRCHRRKLERDRDGTSHRHRRLRQDRTRPACRRDRRDTVARRLPRLPSRNASLPGLPHFATIEELLAKGRRSMRFRCARRRRCGARRPWAALAAGKHVMLEKPPGTGVAELDPLIAMAAQAKAHAVRDLALAPCAGGRTGARMAGARAVSRPWTSAGRRMSASGTPDRAGSGNPAGSGCSIPASTRSRS